MPPASWTSIWMTSLPLGACTPASAPALASADGATATFWRASECTFIVMVTSTGYGAGRQRQLCSAVSGDRHWLPRLLTCSPCRCQLGIAALGLGMQALCAESVLCISAGSLSSIPGGWRGRRARQSSDDSVESCLCKPPGRITDLTYKCRLPGLGRLSKLPQQIRLL